MKVSELRVGGVYVGKDGALRRITEIRPNFMAGYQVCVQYVFSDREGSGGYITAKSFARWAEREDRGETEWAQFRS